MKLNVTIDEKFLQVDVPEPFLQEAEDFFQKMDHDMDRGWQMGTEFLEHLTQINRCQIAADRLLGSLSSANETMVMLMAGYILKRLSGVTGVAIDTHGEMLNTEFSFVRASASAATSSSVPSERNLGAPTQSGDLSKLEAMNQAGREVSKVYKVGKGYRYAVMDRQSGHWMESPILENEREANKQRAEALKSRLDKLSSTEK
jgi:hypothetical protein